MSLDGRYNIEISSNFTSVLLELTMSEEEEEGGFFFIGVNNERGWSEICGSIEMLDVMVKF